jgi:hypothetical protein
MSIAKTYDRPLAVVAATETTVLSAALTEGASEFIVDVHFTNADITGDKAAGRFKIVPTVSNGQLGFSVQYIAFDAESYVSATDPADSVGSTVQAIGSTARQNLDALHTSAGDPRS